MNPRVVQAIAHDDYTLTLTFANGEVKVFDVRPYLDKGIFQELENLAIFRAVQVSMGTASWPHGQDFCPDTLYQESVPVEERSENLVMAEQD